MAATGTASTLIEATAVSVGAGMLLGGFLAGLVALVLGLGSREREDAMAFGGSLGGLATALVLVMETIAR